MNEKKVLKILVVDDNIAIHRDIVKILTVPEESNLKKLNQTLFATDETKKKSYLPEFKIDTASSGEEGFALVKKSVQDKNPYALAFVDIRMPPGWDGIETIKHMWQLDNNIQVVICTAFSDYTWEQTIEQLGETDNLLILKKPFDNTTVRQLAYALTKKWQLTNDSLQYTSLLEQQVNERTSALQESYSLVKATLESSNDGVLVVNNQNQIVDYNQKTVNMWQLSKTLLDKKQAMQLCEFMKDQVENPDEFFRNIQELMADKDSVRIDTIRFKDGKLYEYYTQPQKLKEETIGRVFNFRDITERDKLEKILHHQATHDALTGLSNRILLIDKINQSIKAAQKNHAGFSLLFLDLDRFKLINDSFSHAVGDALLQEISKRLRTVIDEDETISRLGGDEFVVILNQNVDLKYITTKAKKIIEQIVKPYPVENRQVKVGVSIGVCIYPKDGDTAEILLRNADNAMYAAKKRHTDNFQFYSDEMSLQSLARLEQEIQIREALTKDEFFLTYQPEVDLANGKIVAVEALLRWQHPQKGVIQPLDFLNVAEDTGLILPIGEMVLRRACAQNKAWQRAGFAPIRVAVNITSAQILNQNLVTLVKDVLKETKLDAKYLELELTENILVGSDEVIHTINNLKKIGLIISIDDFGTGYSSLSSLRKIPIDRLKIDSSFVRHLNSEDDAVVIRAIIALAKNLNLEVIAEGVENQGQLDFLKKHDCSDIQGFYFSKPLTPENLEGLLKDSSSLQKILHLESEAH